MLSPHAYLLAVLFRHRAFHSKSLNNNPDTLVTINLHPKGGDEIKLPLQANMADVFLFRRSRRMPLGGWRISETEPIPPKMMTDWIQRVGLLVGFKTNTISYSLRYGQGNKLDQDHMSPGPLSGLSSVLTAQITSAMPCGIWFSITPQLPAHSRAHYLNRNVGIDVQALHRESRHSNP